MVSKFRLSWVAVCDVFWMIVNYPGVIFWKAVIRIVKVEVVE